MTEQEPDEPSERVMFGDFSTMAFDDLDELASEVEQDALVIFEEDEGYLGEFSDEEFEEDEGYLGEFSDEEFEEDEGYLGELSDEEFEEDEGYLGELSDEELGTVEDALELGESFREAMSEKYADAPHEVVEESLENVFDSLTPAESFSFAKALRQIEAGAGKAVRDPTFGQIAGQVLPLAGGVMGTAVGGPGVGTAIGSTLGGAAAKALPGDRKPRSAAPVVPVLKASATGGLPAAAKGLVLMNNPAVQKAALAAALGPHGQGSLNGIPVGAFMNMLSTIFGQAAAEADQLLYESTTTTPAYWPDEEAPAYADPAVPGDRAQALYGAIMRAEDQRLAEAEDW